MGDDRLTELYRLYGPAIYARCRKLLTDPATAEDACQETFVRVHRHLDKAPSADEALAWIYRIATNYCLNELRDAKHRPRPVEILPEAPQSLRDEDRVADRDLARRLIDRAPEKVRAVAWLYHVDGFDQDEVARLLGISRRTVVNRLQAFAAGARKYLARAAS
ncbi:MAG TPA: sigma-70 family RNA polymerase sigma factor [Polyangia bacterium]|jgi:RNA polymerase sigma-70 factor (ECF subfamily)|nr:sigma-70 family RNA polymerase sigma factor [Polyangia bacterium]